MPPERARARTKFASPVLPQKRGGANNQTKVSSINNMDEPIFSRQEQGVVYLFSRYWDQIDRFKGKRIHNIHTHFPDFELENIETGAIEAIEFEYGLKDFASHLNDKHLKKLKKDDIKRLNIIYWDEDADEAKVRQQIERHFAGEVEFVRLSEYFSPCVKPDSDCLRASWTFSLKKQRCETYPLRKIEKCTKALVEAHAFERLPWCPRLYRTLGFNKEFADFIECAHWENIHFFRTTNRFDTDNIPSKLFVKLNRCQHFAGYFVVRDAFVIAKVSPRVKEYFRDFYFFPYDPDYKDSISFVYSRFEPLDYNQGQDLYRYLKKNGFALQRSSELISDSHVREVDRIIG